MQDADDWYTYKESQNENIMRLKHFQLPWRVIEEPISFWRYDQDEKETDPLNDLKTDLGINNTSWSFTRRVE